MKIKLIPDGLHCLILETGNSEEEYDLWSWPTSDRSNVFEIHYFSGSPLDPKPRLLQRLELPTRSERSDFWNCEKVCWCLVLYPHPDSGCASALTPLLELLTSLAHERFGVSEMKVYTWRQGADFINILRAALMHTDSKSTKRYWQLDWIFMLLGSACVKAAHKHVGEIDPSW